MANLPSSGQSDSMDNTSVTRNEFRTGMGNMLSYLAKALGNEDTYTTQTVSPEAVKLNGSPTAPTASPGDNSTAIATTAFVTAAVEVGGGGGGGGGSLGDLGNVVAGGYIRGNGTFDASKCLNIASVDSSVGTGRKTINFTDALSTTEYIVLINPVIDQVSASGQSAFSIINYTRTDSFDVTTKQGNSFQDYDFGFMVVEPTGSTRNASPFALTSDSIWGIFNGNTGAKISGNGYSVSRSNAGQYNITFDSPLPDTNYSVVQGLGHDSGTRHSSRVDNTSKTVNGFAIRTGRSDTDTFQDKNEIYFYVLHESMVGSGGGFDAAAYVKSDGTFNESESYNIASVTRTGTGRYTIAFETPLSSNEYVTSVNVVVNSTINSGQGFFATINEQRTDGFDVTTKQTNSYTDLDFSFSVSSANSGGGSGGGSSSIPIQDIDTVGSMAYLQLTVDSRTYQYGDSVSASELKPASSGGNSDNSTGVVTGTWRCLGYCSRTNSMSSHQATMFQKISDTTRAAEIKASVKKKAKELKEGYEPSISTMPVPEEEAEVSTMPVPLDEPEVSTMPVPEETPEASTMPAPEKKRTRKKK